MITVNSRDFGNVEVNEESIFSFPNGIFAFEDSKEFALISPLGGEQYPMWLQATTDINPCFIVFDPKLIVPDYTPILSKSEKALLGADETTELRSLVIAKVPSDYKDTTVNMKSPIVVNMKTKLATQVILSEDFSFRLPVYKKEENN